MIAKRVMERSRRERGAIDREKLRRRCSLSNMLLVQGCQISREVRSGMTALPNLTGGRPD